MWDRWPAVEPEKLASRRRSPASSQTNASNPRSTRSDRSTKIPPANERNLPRFDAIPGRYHTGPAKCTLSRLDHVARSPPYSSAGRGYRATELASQREATLLECSVDRPTRHRRTDTSNGSQTWQRISVLRFRLRRSRPDPSFWILNQACARGRSRPDEIARQEQSFDVPLESEQYRRGLFSRSPCKRP